MVNRLYKITNAISNESLPVGTNLAQKCSQGNESRTKVFLLELILLKNARKENYATALYVQRQVKQNVELAM